MEGQEIQVLNPEKLKALNEWVQETSITLTQVNGQRKYGGPPPGWRGPVPGPGCEVFINQIPRDVFENCLIPLFQSVAPLYEFRLMMNFSGQNRGFAYAKYGDPGAAAMAIQTLNQYILEEGVQLTVKRSTEKRQLCLGDLPPHLSREELLAFLRLISEGVEGVTVKVSGAKGKEVYALVQYSSHYTASMAKKVLVEAFKKRLGVIISIRWMSCGSKFRSDERHEEIPLAPPGLKAPIKSAPTPPRFQLHQPAQHPRYKDPLPPPPPPPANLFPPPHHTQHFSRAVGGPTAYTRNEMVPPTPRRPSDTVGQLQWLCELHNLGIPLYDVSNLYTGPDGFLNFTYRVIVPGLPGPLCGFVQILPGTNPNTTKSEVHRAIAEKVIKDIFQES